MYSCMNIDSVPTTVFFSEPTPFRNRFQSESNRKRVMAGSTKAAREKVRAEQKIHVQQAKYCPSKTAVAWFTMEPNIQPTTIYRMFYHTGHLLSRVLLDHFVHVEKFFNGSSESDRHYSGTAMHTTWVTPRGWAFAYFTMRNVLDNTRECDRRY